jgi:hypothetical protein
MIKAMTETEKQQVEFFNKHSRRMIPVLVYQKIDKTNIVEIQEWNNILILLGATGEPTLFSPPEKTTQGLVLGKAFMGPGASLL